MTTSHNAPTLTGLRLKEINMQDYKGHFVAFQKEPSGNLNMGYMLDTLTNLLLIFSYDFVGECPYSEAIRAEILPNVYTPHTHTQENV